jgi:nucleoside-diphosphate-sugar epimerase
MRIAILGATSQIAKDLVLSFAAQTNYELVLYARRPEVVSQWLGSVNMTERYTVTDFAALSTNEHFDAMLNFVGVGNPTQTAAMGASIFDVTLKYDQMALDYAHKHPTCRYIFLSSGAAYGSSFDEPVDQNTKAEISINNLKLQDWYAVAKLYAECRHRSLPHLPIVDVRVFNYFSHTQDIEARFLITDILRAIRDRTVLRTSTDFIVRDFINPLDFYKLVLAILSGPAVNAAIDCYSREPVTKPNLLTAMQDKFGLQYEITQASVSTNATGIKPHYYSLNTRAADFGYEPTLTSLESIVKEIQMFFQGAVRISGSE